MPGWSIRDRAPPCPGVGAVGGRKAPGHEDLKRLISYTPTGDVTIESSQRLGRHRWVVERTVSWLAGCRRLRRRYERKPEHFLGFVGIAATLICHRRLAAA
ncbi:transposase [Streptomyces olivochromogenes]|uniref:transposase n=1 Tax=Streptomyces olivochromogenes TaxID=1963 RepID=UPI0036DD2B23